MVTLKNTGLLFISLLLMTACTNKKERLLIAKETGISPEPKKILAIEKKREATIEPIRKTKQKSIPKSKHVALFKLRKHTHVTELYMNLAQTTIDLCVQKNVPPAAILAIVSLESGWGSGYIGQITGNILSLNATKNSPKLPPLYLPVLKKGDKVLFDEKEIAKYKKSELEYQNRPESLKKDYRPSSIAGTTENLAYFRYHPDEYLKAQMKCINDFITRFISYNSSIAAYREARTLLDDQVEKNGMAALFDIAVNIQFINTIGGKPNSFNFRETWPKKVEKVLTDAGLVELTYEMQLNDKSFEEAW